MAGNQNFQNSNFQEIREGQNLTMRVYQKASPQIFFKLKFIIKFMESKPHSIEMLVSIRFCTWWRRSPLSVSSYNNKMTFQTRIDMLISMLLHTWQMIHVISFYVLLMKLYIYFVMELDWVYHTMVRESYLHQFKYLITKCFSSTTKK